MVGFLCEKYSQHNNNGVLQHTMLLHFKNLVKAVEKKIYFSTIFSWNKPVSALSYSSLIQWAFF